MGVCGPTFVEFFYHEFGPLVAFLQKIGFEREQAKDAASEAMTCAYQSLVADRSVTSGLGTQGRLPHRLRSDSTRPRRAPPGRRRRLGHLHSLRR
jgi:hypothetical protein